ncbi:undecaprenyl-diphosphate phosphatase [Waterburya agarophytonicola K14]|uniref:Undecaprenyl-diphosphatase n=1 Tax=Waterburya agarophytonicola KI4 TaxID=2874699 RepID=A0A964FHG4_9CYAN|nr:undecaprenyl-diphosphate phosphatase [Waterburya agarophytonicola]MCC0177478.1 undecaprenyl-diphosphate phosphatase [Waterburya agarophytonicola KI4]
MFRQIKKYFSFICYLCLGLIVSVLSSTIASSSAIASSAEIIAQGAVGETTQVNLFQAIVLGFVQGATEFIPISSTAHLKAIPVFFGWGDPGVSFSAVIQLGSIAAVLSYFWSDLAQIVKGMIKAIRTSDYDSQEFWMAVGIGVGSIPIIFFGLLLTIYEPAFYENTLRSMTSIAIVSILMAILLALAESIGNQKRNFKDLTVKDGILIGLAQAMAIVPGTSRSGSTMTAGLFSNLDRETAARYSFLLGIPAITLAGLVGLKDLISPVEGEAILFIPLIGGLISSAIFSYIAIAWLLEFLKTRSTWLFVWYRLIFGVGILVAVALGWIK